jgi:phosphoribosylaminoimidazole-succinocarboxamide synthase
MIQAKTIKNAIPKSLKTIDLPLGIKQQGKVRDYYILPDFRVIITTDRQSAFDRVLGEIPYKGAVLNQLAAFWFDKTAKIIPNHLLTVPDPNVSVTKNLTGIPIEMIVRGYISGVTGTSIWGSYQKGDRVIYGIRFPDGLQKNQQLETPVITPTTHGDLTGKGGHDERLTRDQILSKDFYEEVIVNNLGITYNQFKKLYTQMEEAAIEIFKLGSKIAKKQGLILVDTKYEFGIDDNGILHIMDEVHTPDSSRFWKADTYERKLKRGEEPENFDKEFLRLWYAERGYKGDGIPPKMSEELIIALSQRYIKVYEMLTGKKFAAFEYPIDERIKKNLTSRYN